jgi:hypothetical protein
MLVFVKHDPISVMNYVNENYPGWKGNFSVVLGVSRAKGRAERMFVFESELVVSAMSEKPLVADENGKIDWEAVETYVQARPGIAANFTVRPNRIVQELSNTAVDREHALSALSSNIRHDLRPHVIGEIVAFLSDPKRGKYFTLPNHLAPQRGKTKALYDVVMATDFGNLKKAISGKGEDYFEATYWRSVIAKHKNSGKSPKRLR